MKKAKILLFLLLAVATPKFLQTDYTIRTEVIEVIQPNTENIYGLVLCEAENGDIFSFEGSEDWFAGDIAELTMNDNGTAFTNKDDVIKRAIYKGYIY